MGFNFRSTLSFLGQVLRGVVPAAFTILIIMFVLLSLKEHLKTDSLEFGGDKNLVVIENGKETTLEIRKTEEYEHKNAILILNDPTNTITMVQLKKSLYRIKANKEGKVKAEIHLTGYGYYMPILITVERPHNLLPVENNSIRTR